MTVGNRSRKKNKTPARVRREVDRQVDRDMRSRAGQNKANAGVPLARGEAAIKSNVKVNGQLIKEQKNFRSLVHKSGAGGCNPLMASVVSTATHPFGRIDHVVMPRNRSLVLADVNGPFVTQGVNYRDIPRGQLFQHDYAFTFNTSATGDFAFNISRRGMPYAQGGDSWWAIVNQSTYIDFSKTGGTGWDVTKLQFANASAPVDGRPYPPDGAGTYAPERVACIGLKVTFENLVEAIADQKGVCSMGQNMGQLNNWSQSFLGQQWWATVYDGATTVAQPSMSLIPDGNWYCTNLEEPPNIAGQLLDTCGLVASGTGYTPDTPIIVRIQAAYIHAGTVVPPTTPIIYHTPSFECGVICLGGDQAGVNYEEPTGADPLKSRQAAEVRRDAQTRAAAVQQFTMPEWVIDVGQRALPYLGKMLAKGFEAL